MAILLVVNHARVPVAPAANVPAVRADSPSIIFVLLFIVCFLFPRCARIWRNTRLCGPIGVFGSAVEGDNFLINATEKETYINKIRE